MYKENAIAFNYLWVKVHGAALSNEVIGLESVEKCYHASMNQDFNRYGKNLWLM